MLKFSFWPQEGSRDNSVIKLNSFLSPRDFNCFVLVFNVYTNVCVVSALCVDSDFAARASLRLLRSLMLTMSRPLFSLIMSRTLLW